MATEQSTVLSTLRKKRSVIKSQVTRIQSYLNEHADMDVVALGSRKAKLEELSSAYAEVQLAIELEDSEVDQDTERSEFEFRYFDILDSIERRLRRYQNLQPTAGISNLRAVDSPTTIIKQANNLLPKIEIRPFDGNPIEWHSFHDTFKTLVHDNDELPAVQKFHLLKNSLRSEVASVIASLNASEQNYWVAWDLLQKRCNKPRQIVQAHLKSLVDLSEISRDTPVNLRTLSEQAQMHVKALAALNQPVSHWDSILVFLVVRRLDKNTRRAWERSLENDEVPKFDQLVNFINKQARGEEYESEELTTINSNVSDNRTRVKTNKRGQTYVSTTNNSKNKCTLCKQDHEIFSC